MSSPTTVVVLGAGPAGSTAARLLASWGHDVVVLTRRTGAASARALAESLPPSCVSLLERVGFAGLTSAGFLRSTGNTVHWGKDRRVERYEENRFGYQVERNELDALLAREAAGAGAQMRAGASVTSVERATDRTRIAYEQDGARHSLDAAWVLDCTGRVGVIARAGWRQHDAGGRTTALVGIWESSVWTGEDPSHTIVESTSDGWAWSVPVSERRRYVTLMVDPVVTQLGSRAGMDHAYAAQLARTQVLSALVANARRVAPVFAQDASPYSARSYGERGLLLVGDAGSFVDPLSSFGIKKAVASAWLAGVVVHSILLDSGIAPSALQLFDARERQMYSALQRASAELAQDAAAASPGEFWSGRIAVASDTELASEPDAAALRQDADVLRAFHELRARPTLQLRQAPGVHRDRRPLVRGNRVVAEEHLIVRGFPEGMRYVRNVDLVRVMELAPQHHQVPDLFDAYNRAAPPVPLPDFLGALSLLIGKGILEWEGQVA